MCEHEIKLLGGPADGQRIAVPEDVTTPPQTVELQELPLQALLNSLTQENVTEELPDELRSALAGVCGGGVTPTPEAEPLNCVVYYFDRSFEEESTWQYLYEGAKAV